MSQKKLKKQLKSMKQQSQQSQVESQQTQLSNQLDFISRIKKKETITVTFRGVLQYAHLPFTQSMSIMYQIVVGQNWKILLGQTSGISQHSAHSGDSLVWNFPFNISIQSKNPQNWPQLLVILYGKDFFGRSIVKGYGNIHLPVSKGIQKRQIQIFDTIPPNNTATFCANLMGYINELKNPEQVLLEKDGGRQFLQTKTLGKVVLKVQVRRYNFQMYGYD